MNKIICDVTTCSHNKDEMCCANRVNIGGKSACNDMSTCCGSYLNSLLYSDLTDAKSESGNCDCLVCYSKTCKHNENCICNLEAINVSGSEAAIYTETCCSSFEKNDL